MAYLPRGIDPELLVSQVKNTMPYLFDAYSEASSLGQLIPAQIVRSHQADPARVLTHAEYFKLCLSAHYLTCATPVPTDVDNQIRHKLWPAGLPLEMALEMAQFVLGSRKWDFTLLSRRFTYGARESVWEKEVILGHLGEWFTVAAGAYCALGRYKATAALRVRNELFEEIAGEVNRHSEIFGSLWKGGYGVGCLKASASVAHNFGDLDRVMDMWELSVVDPLRLRFYKLTVLPFDADRKLRYLGRLWVAGELYKSPIAGSSMALENHRHFALRKPRALRQDSDLMITTGPFLDDWGRRVASALAESGKPSDHTLEVVDTLKQGWNRLPKTVGYGRALSGIFQVHAELGSVSVESEQAFEKSWALEALRLMDDIPSRA
jgi:hypothetical protein